MCLLFILLAVDNLNKSQRNVSIHQEPYAAAIHSGQEYLLLLQVIAYPGRCCRHVPPPCNTWTAAALHAGYQVDPVAVWTNGGTGECRIMKAVTLSLNTSTHSLTRNFTPPRTIWSSTHLVLWPLASCCTVQRYLLSSSFCWPGF